MANWNLDGMWKFADRHPWMFRACVASVAGGVVGVVKALMSPFAKAPTGPVVNIDGESISKALSSIVLKEPEMDISTAENEEGPTEVLEYDEEVV